MRNYRAIGALALGVGLLVVPGPGASAHHDDLRVFADVSHVFYTDGGAPGYSAGDTRTVLSDLRNREGKARGWSQWICTVTRYDNGGQDFEADCDANFSLRDGDVSAIGRLTDEDLNDDVVFWTIDGGTGHYDGARGTLSIRVLRHHGRMHGHQVASMEAPEEPPGRGQQPPGVGNDKEKPDEPEPDGPGQDEPGQDDEGRGGDGGDRDGDRDWDRDRHRDWDRDWDRNRDHRCHTHGDRGGHCHDHGRDHDHDWDKDRDHDRTEEPDYEVSFDFEN